MEISREEKLLAAVAHGAVVTQGVGIIVGLLIYFNRRDKQNWLAFQSLQAALYQLVGMAAIIGSWLLWTLFYFATLVPMITLGESNPRASMVWLWIGLGSMVFPVLLHIGVSLFGIVAAFRAWAGKDFRYPLIGRGANFVLERMVEEKATPEAA